MKSRNRCTEDYRTARQWAKAGFIVNDTASGTVMWTNCFHQNMSTYYLQSEVHRGNAAEIEEFFKPEKERRNELAKQRRLFAKIEKQNLEKEAAEIEAARILNAKIEKQLLEKKAAASELCRKAATQPLIPCTNASGLVVLDLATTGLDINNDEILQISAIDGDGNILLNSYVKPYYTDIWPDAQIINGISPEMVATAPQLHELLPQIHGIISSADTIVVYNSDFDLLFGPVPFIDWIHEKGCSIMDVMVLFAPIYGEDLYDDGSYEYKSLAICADYYGYTFKAQHDSLENAKATLFCFSALNKFSMDELIKK